MGILRRMLGLAEKRATLANPPEWLADSLTWDKVTSGVSVNARTMLTSTAVYACIRVLAEGVAMLPLPVYKKSAGSRRQKERDSTHPLYRVLHDQANPLQTAFEFRETMQAQLCVRGNAFAEIERDGAGRVVGLWPLHADKMTVKFLSRGVKVYEYQIPGGGGVSMNSSAVFHLRGFAQQGLVGLALASMAKETVGLDLAMREYGARFFGNSARPGGVLERPAGAPKLNDDGRASLKKQFEKLYGGLSNAHRTAILEEGMQWKQVGISPEDAQLLEERRFSVQEIARLFRVPPHMIAELSNATFSNIEHQGIEFVVHTLGPWLKRWEQRISLDLLSDAEKRTYFAEFLVDGLLRGDINSRYSAYATGVQWGWFSPNDVRDLENLNPREGGDEYLMPVNMVVSGETPQTGNDGDDGTRSTAPIETRKRAIAETRAASMTKLRNHWKPVLREAARRLVKREVDAFRKATEKHLTIRDAVSFSVWLDTFAADHPATITDVLGPMLRAYMDAVTTNAADLLDKSRPDNMERFFENYLASFAGKRAKLLAREIAALVADADQAEVLDVVNTRLDEWDEKGADKVAENESSKAGNAAAKFSWVLLGVTLFRWVANAGACPLCEQVGGTVVGSEQVFVPAGGVVKAEGVAPLRVSSSIGHPPLHGGCVCEIVPEAE